MFFVTGGTGLLGMYLLKELTEVKTSVIRVGIRKTSNINVVREFFKCTTNNPDERFNMIKWFEYDINDIYSISEAIGDSKIVFHCAAEIAFSKKKRSVMYETNVKGTRNLVNACLEKNDIKLCHVSSTGTLGFTSENELIDENSCLNLSNDSSYYSFTKKQAEFEVLRGIYEGLNAFIVNPSIIIGLPIRKNGDFFSFVKKFGKFYPPGGYGFVYAKDVAKQMIKLMEINSPLPQKIIINSENLTYYELFKIIAENLNVKPPRIKLDKFSLEIALVLSKIISIFSNERYNLTREIVNTSCKNYRFNGNKCISITKIDYTPINEAVKEICEQIKKKDDLNEKA